MQLTPYLMFDGRCAEAFEYYAKLFGGEIVMMQSHANTPAAEHVPAEWHDKIMHARMTIPGGELMGSDAPPQYQEKLAGFSLAVGLDDEADARRIFEGLSNGGAVKMPLEETFWARLFGMVTDRFGVHWMINVDG